VYRGERTTTTSVTAAPEAAGNAASRTFFARSDCGLFVGFPSVVNAPPNNAPIKTTATTIAATHPPTVRHGCLALAHTNRLNHVPFIFPPVLAVPVDALPESTSGWCKHGAGAGN
jgi:hypothetical protein